MAKCFLVIAGLQDKETGSFMGDEWGELDTRFLYGALNALSLLGLLDLVDMDKAVSYVQKCENLDGGYGVCPGAESHSGQVFTCVGALAIAGRAQKFAQPVRPATTHAMAPSRTSKFVRCKIVPDTDSLQLLLEASRRRANRKATVRTLVPQLGQFMVLMLSQKQRNVCFRFSCERPS